MFSFIKETLLQGLQKAKSALGFSDSNNQFDFVTIEKILIENNFAVDLIKRLIDILKKNNKENVSWIDIISDELNNILKDTSKYQDDGFAYMLVGINGSGKTTSAIKLARLFKNEQNKKTLVIAADTFRAAAVNQIDELCIQNNIDIFKDESLTDPSAVIFKGLIFAKENQYEKVIIDTAGRIHQKDFLMREVKKMQKTAISKIEPLKLKTFLVLDGLQGKALETQASIFKKDLNIEGIILTKLDSISKPGIIFSIVDTYKIPIVYLSAGQKETELIKFEANTFIKTFIGN
jgi:fused signal recognition particle receptor